MIFYGQAKAVTVNDPGTLLRINDQIGTPTYTLDLARILVNKGLTEKYGYYHAAKKGDYIS